MRSVGPAQIQLPQLRAIPDELTVERSDILTYDLNPFSFYVNYDSTSMLHVDSKVQEFGAHYKDDDHAEEPERYAMIRHNGRWYRAQVLEKYYDSNEECSEAEVSLIDVGRKAVIEIGNIFPMKREVLAAGPAQCLRVFPKNVRSFSRELGVLFEDYPEMKLRLVFDANLSLTTRQKPHLVGVAAEVHVGHKSWILLQDLLETFLRTRDEEDLDGAREIRNGAESSSDNETFEAGDVAVRPRPATDRSSQSDRSSISRRESNQPERSGASEPSECRSNVSAGTQRVDHGVVAASVEATSRDAAGKAGAWNSRLADDTEFAAEFVERPSRATRSNVSAGTDVRRKTANVDLDSDDDSNNGNDQLDEEEDSQEIVRFHSVTRGVPSDVDGENQAAFTTTRSFKNAERTAKMNEHRPKLCKKFKKMGQCEEGELCPHSHEESLEKTLTSTGLTTQFRDFRDINLDEVKCAFGLCTHVEENGIFYLVLPYGPVTIWDVMELKLKEVDMRDIATRLSISYDPRRGKKHDYIAHTENLAVAWVGASESGLLGNVCQGWYRVKILKREASSCRVFLVDHGATLMIKLEDLYTFENGLLDFPQQAIRCQLQEIVMKGEAAQMYEVLKGHILIFKIYDKEDSNPHVVELVKVHCENDSTELIHCGETLVGNGIAQWKNG